MSVAKQIFKSNDSRLIPYHVARGDQLLQDMVFAPETIRRGLKLLEVEFGAGKLAYTPEMLHEFETVLQRRYETDDGAYIFEMPNSSVYDDPEIAAFYGVQSGLNTNFLRTEKESFQSATERLIQATAKEVAENIPGLVQLHDNFNNESWARYGIAEEMPYCHADPDVTLFRNPQREAWNSMARPASTSQKTNTIDLTDAVGFNIYAQPNEGWQIDDRGGFYDKLPPVPEGPAYGF